MYIHAFAFRWKPGVDDAQKKRVQGEIRRFQGKIPGLLETSIGENTSLRGQGYEMGCVMKFADKASLDAYQVRPDHVKLISWLMPLVDPVEIDFEA